MRRRTQPEIYFTCLRLENVRSFSDTQELKLLTKTGGPASWTLIVGDNGVGKTTLLQCLTRMRPIFNDPPDVKEESPPQPVEPELAREGRNDVLRGFARSASYKPVKLRAELSVGLSLTGQRRRSAGTISTTFEFTPTKASIKNVDSGGDFTRRVKEPLVLAYGAGRHPSVGEPDQSIFSTLTDSLFRVEAELYDAEELLHQLDYSSYKGQSDAKERLDSLKKMLSMMLPEIDSPEAIEILDRR